MVALKVDSIIGISPQRELDGGSIKISDICVALMVAVQVQLCFEDPTLPLVHMHISVLFSLCSQSNGEKLSTPSPA